MTAEQRAKLYPVILIEYNPDWIIWYSEEQSKIEQAVGLESIARIRHCGSTSIPGMLAKPTVDILLEIPESADVTGMKERMKSVGYWCLDGASLTMDTPPPHMMFLGGYTSCGFAQRVFHIHVQYIGDREPDEILFRNYLIAHPEKAQEYADLKRSLWKDFEYNRDGYTLAKSKFILSVTKKAREDKRV